MGIYNIRYITIKKTDDYEKIHSVNPLYLMIHEVIRHIEGKNKNRYLVFDLADKKKILKNTQNFGMALKMRMRL